MELPEIQQYCQIVRKRSSEHIEAMKRVHDLPGIMAVILRLELDSAIRTIYLLSIENIDERKRLIAQTLSGEEWAVKTSNGKMRRVTDREIVELSDRLNGWALSVYKFGCAFVHFSRFHNYSEANPFESLNAKEQGNILAHLRNYHGGPKENDPSFETLSIFFPKVLEKISGNLECYIEDLEAGRSPELW